MLFIVNLVSSVWMWKLKNTTYSICYLTSVSYCSWHPACRPNQWRQAGMLATPWSIKSYLTSVSYCSWHPACRPGQWRQAGRGSAGRTWPHSPAGPPAPSSCSSHTSPPGSRTSGGWWDSWSFRRGHRCRRCWCHRRSHHPRPTSRLQASGGAWSNSHLGIREVMATYL